MIANISILGGQILALVAVTLVLRRLVITVFSLLAARSPAFEQRQELGPRLATIVLVLGAVLIIAVIAFNGYLLATGADLGPFYREQLARTPPGFWSSLAIGLVLTLLMAVAGLFVSRLIRRGLARLEQIAKEYEQIRANDESIERLFAMLNRIQRISIVLLVAWQGARVLGLPSSLVVFIALGLRIYLIIAMGRLIVQAVAAIVDSLEALSRRYTRTQGPGLVEIYERLEGLVPLFRRSLEYAIYVAVATLVLLQVETVARFAEWGPRLAQVIGIVFLARVVVELTNLLVDRKMQGEGDLQLEAQQRRLTLGPLIKSVLKYVVFFSAFVLILNALQLNPAPILAGAGIVTVVVGLGAQPLINDIVSGFFILFENLFLVGDYIETGTARGTVEAIDIRTTRIRDPDGQQHILRNGQLGEVINFSKSYTNAVVNVGVAYDSDLTQVYTILEEVGRAFAAENPDVLEPTRVDGLEDFGASELRVRTVTRVKPGQHRQLARILRRRIKDAFDEHGVEIPFAQHVVHFHPAGSQAVLERLVQGKNSYDESQVES